jgi:hypothetical protein
MVRASRYKRKETDKSLWFTARDFSILYALYKYHLLTTHQLVACHAGNAQKTRHRLRELFDAEFVARFHTKTDLTTPGSDPVVYALTDRGANWLSAHRPDVERLRARYNERNAKRTLLSIPHALLVADVMLAFETASRLHAEEVAFLSQLSLLARAPEATRNRRSPTHWSSKVPQKGAREPLAIGNNPDQIFGLELRQREAGHNRMYFFLEADRGTESVRPVTAHLEKATIYKKLLGYYHTHLKKVHQGVFGEWLSNFRVLWVIDSNAKARDGKTRLQHFLETAQVATDGHLPDMFLFTTSEALNASQNPLTHEWVNMRGEVRRILP